MDDFLPSEFHLSQNYPNPFKEKTIIKYCVPFKTKINLEVFNLEGNRIAVLVNEVKRASTYQIKFDATGLPSGIYFYKLQAGSFVETKKMILIR